MSLERLVGVGDVVGVVRVVMDFHRLGIDVRLERIEPVGKRRKHKWHGGTLPWFEFVFLPRNQSKRSAIPNLETSRLAPARPRPAARSRQDRPGSATTAV